MFTSGITPEAGAVLSEGFGGVARIIHDSMEEWSQREGDGEKAAREETHTERLLSELKQQFTADSPLGRKLGGAGISVTCETFNAPQRDETKYGIDVGMRVSIEYTGFKITKAILIQCKKMSKVSEGGVFGQLRDDGESQAKKMLRVTPASFFMLYSAGDNWELLKKADRLRRCGFCGEHTCDIFLGCFLCHKDGGLSWDMGVSLIPASRVLAYTYGKGRGKFPIESDVVLRGALPLGVFMSDMVVSCMIGDVRREVIDIVTPPGKRDSHSTGLAPRWVDDLNASSYIDLRISAE